MLSYEFPPLGGGGSRVVYGLSKELVQAGHEVDIVTMRFRGLAEQEKTDGINILRVPCIRFRESTCSSPEMMTYIASAIPYVLRLQRQRDYDINNTHFIYPDGLISYLIKKKTGLPFIITAHGSDVPGYNPHRFKWQHRILLPAWKKIIREAGAIICPSHHLSALVKENSHSTYPTIIPNGIDTDMFKMTGGKQERILIVTRMYERKGIQYFIEALNGMNINHEINIVGDGPYLNALQRMASRLTTKVRFWGWLDNKSSELKKLYETSSIFLLPSESENFPIVLLEAMSAGMAVITTAGTGCEEVVGDTGLLVPPKDPNAIKQALTRLMNDDQLVIQLGKAARRRVVKRFGWETVSQQYVDMYRKYALTQQKSASLS